MKNYFFLFLVMAISLLTTPVFSQTATQTAADTPLLGLPGDNLDLYAVLDLFQKSKTIEDFEKLLNEETTGINNLDLNLDNTVDFIKVVTTQDKNEFTFVLQVDVNEKEVQDVAVILVSKDEKGKVTMQIVGDKNLYGNDYVIEPKPAVTANPAYTGSNPVTVTTESETSVVVVESAPIVQYVYSPVYVPYYTPYCYGYYPSYHATFAVIAVGVYRHNHYHHHHRYYGGGYGNTVVIHNGNHYKHYNNSRNSSSTVSHYSANGNYNRNETLTRPSTGSSTLSTRPSTTPSTKGSPASTTRPSTTPLTSQSKGPSPTRLPGARGGAGGGRR